MPQTKSSATLALDVIRNLLILGLTAYITLLIWRWYWLAALVACVPLYIVLLNVVGFATLPLYAFTPEVRSARQAQKKMFKGGR
jgi:hypothetical protein